MRTLNTHTPHIHRDSQISQMRLHNPDYFIVQTLDCLSLILRSFWPRVETDSRSLLVLFKSIKKHPDQGFCTHTHTQCHHIKETHVLLPEFTVRPVTPSVRPQTRSSSTTHSLSLKKVFQRPVPSVCPNCFSAQFSPLCLGVIIFLCDCVRG